MKRKILALIILVAFAGLPPEALAYERNFPAGSIIIPMDAFYQPDDDGGLYEGYGLAYYLLDHQDPQCLTDAPTDADTLKCQTECGGDSACEQACVQDALAACEHTISVSWVINDQKTTIDGVDLVIEDNTLPREVEEDGVEIEEVVRLYDHNGGTQEVDFDLVHGDSKTRISYRGSLWIIDVQELADGVVDELYALIDSDSWDAVNVHVAQVPFAAPVFRDMRGTPPKIALMNDGEDKTKGNASILESYLRLAGICSDSYEIVTPNEIAGYAAGDTSTTITPILAARDYDFLWAPHWVGEKNYDGTKGLAHQDEVVEQVQLYLKRGKGLLAECASIETFEHSPKGHFLADKDFGHNGVDVKKDTNVFYSNVDIAYTQIGDFPDRFSPQGGHLHNWRPYQAGDPFNFDDLPDVSGGNSTYNPSVQRFTIDDVNDNDLVDADDWDYFVGGYAYGNDDYGYVVYLGGHSYSDCKDAKEDKEAEEEIDPALHIHPIDIEFGEEITSEAFKLEVHYEQESNEYVETVSFTKAADFTLTVSDTSGPGTPLVIDLSEAAVDSKKKKKLLNIVLRNSDTSDPVTITDIGLSWDGGDKLAKQNPKKLTDLLTDFDHIKNSPNVFTKSPGVNPWEPPGTWDACLLVRPAAFVIDKDNLTTAGASTGPVGCTDNDGCTPKNLGGVRYVLNTLFNIKYDLISHEYVRSAPIVSHPWLYQGTFQHPSYLGHFRRFNVEAESPVADWDTADGKIKDAKTGNSDGRKVYTAAYNDITGDWSKINFDAANVAALLTRLDVDPDNGSTADEIKVIERLRGRYWDYEATPPKFVETTPNKLGGIMHSAPVIVRAGDSRVGGSRAETAYVGDIYGMLHAIDTASGLEKWAYIPSNLLGKLKNNRTDPNAEPDFAAVDGSPTAKDIYWDHDGDGDLEWRTILICTEGFGGNSIFALDVTDPTDWQVLWEATDDISIGGEAPGGGMGYAFRAALDKVKVPALDVYGNPILDSYGYPTYTVKWMVYVATSFAEIAEEHGGINVFAFDLKTGTEQWTFSSTYADSVNDIPGAVTTYDIDDDTLADRLYVGDMNGRMWELALTDDPAGNWLAGESVHIYDGKNEENKGLVKGMGIPLFNAGIGNPISVSPAITKRNGHVLLIFGTGGADWASDTKGYHVYAVDASAAGYLNQDDKDKNFKDTGGAIDAVWSLATAKGEKVWSSPTIAAGQIWIVTSFGTMESANPKSDLAGSSNLRVLDLGTGQNIWDDPLQIGKVRGSVFVSHKHAYMTAFDGEIIQLGHATDFAAGTGNRVVLKSWLHQTGSGAAGATESVDESGTESTEETQTDTTPPIGSPVN